MTDLSVVLAAAERATSEAEQAARKAAVAQERAGAATRRAEEQAAAARLRHARDCLSTLTARRSVAVAEVVARRAEFAEAVVAGARWPGGAFLLWAGASATLYALETEAAEALRALGNFHTREPTLPTFAFGAEVTQMLGHAALGKIDAAVADARDARVALLNATAIAEETA